MFPNLSNLLQQNIDRDNEGYTPVFFRLSEKTDCEKLSMLLANNRHISSIDEMHSQLKDLIKLEHPSGILKEEEYETLIEERVSKANRENYGVWVYYPWRNCLIHLLDEEEFVKVRTIRNCFKITKEEQEILRTKKIGVIGLSVGQSVALTIAVERIAGEIRIADFDNLELSNLNRIRTSIQNLGLKKTTIVAREIAEIDPFIQVKVFDMGVNDTNINDFFELGGRLDLLVEEADDLNVKIQSRQKARSLGIPVVMDTSDNFLIDVERFDLDPYRKILHGLTENSDENEELTPERKKELTMKILELGRLSERGQSSILEIKKTITNWPQLATDVFAGGAIAAKFIRHILLKDDIESGRFRLDIIDHYKNHSSNKE